MDRNCYEVNDDNTITHGIHANSGIPVELDFANAFVGIGAVG